jgi:hypothetical protein
MNIGLDWQDADPDAYDPDNPLALLEKAAAAEVDKRAKATVRAIRCMAAGGADAGVMAVARAYAKNHKLLAAAGDFDKIAREAQRGQQDDDSSDKGPTQSEILAAYAQDRYTLHRDADDQPYALPRDGAQIARYLRGGRSLRGELAATYLRERGRPPSSSALADALGAIEGLALTADACDTYIRAAQIDDVVYLDLGREDGAAVRIDATGWDVVAAPPLVWHRTSHTGLLPDPERGGTLDGLWQLARAPEPLQPLAAAWVCCALLGLVTPILDITGEHGSGKTSAAKMIGNLVDTVKPGGPPGNATDLVVSAYRRMIVLIDNLEDMPPWLAATLCRLVTGEELSRRALFTDSDEVVLSLRRPIITTSIDVGAVPADYADRRVGLAFPVLSEDVSLSEEEWTAAWKKARPAGMGAILDLAVLVLAELPDIRLDRTPRMGDYSRVLAAVDKVRGTEGLATYRALRGKAEIDSVESDPATSALLAWLTSKWPGGGPARWEGSMTDLLAAIAPNPEPRDWPKTPRKLQANLAKLAKPLRRVGVDVSSNGDKEPGTRRALWTVNRVPTQSFNPSDPSGTGADQAKQPEGLGEGCQAPEHNPSQILRENTTSDLQEEETKDVKDSEATLLPARCTRCGRLAGPGGILCPPASRRSRMPASDRPHGDHGPQGPRG